MHTFLRFFLFQDNKSNEHIKIPLSANPTTLSTGQCIILFKIIPQDIRTTPFPVSKYGFKPFKATVPFPYPSTQGVLLLYPSIQCSISVVSENKIFQGV